MIWKKTAGIFSLIFCLNLLAACSGPEKDKTEYYQSALEYVKKNENEAAIIQLKNALQIDAKFGAAHYQLGLLYLEDKQPRKAFQALLRAADLQPENLDASLRVAQFYLLSRKTEESRQRVEHILEIEPDHIEALKLLANIDLVEGNYAESIETLNSIGSRVDSSGELQNLKGRIFAAQERWTEAEEAFIKAIDLDEENLSNYRTLLLLFQKQQEKDKAKALLDKMVVKFSDNPLVYQLLANYYRSTNEKELLLVQLKKLVEVAPTNPGFRLQLAEFYRENNKEVEAEKTLSDARLIDGENPDFTAALATLYFDQKKYEEAKMLQDELELKHPGHGGVELLKARFLLDDKKMSDAINILQKLNKDFPKWGEPYFFLGLAHYSLGELDLAHNAVDMAIKKYGRKAKYHTLMAQILQTQGSFEDAQKEAIIALRLNPKNIRSALILSRALIDLKKYEQAITLLNNMNKQVADNIEVLGNLAVSYLGLQEYEQGEKYLTRVLELRPGNTQAVILMLDIKFKNKLAGAEKFLEQQIEQAPENVRLQFVLAEIFIKQEKYEGAFDIFKKLQMNHPERLDAFMAEAILLRKLERNDEALAVYTKVLDKHPDTLEAHMGAADVLQVNGEFKKAMEHYREVLKVKEGYIPAANNLAWLIASEPDGDLGEALMLAMRAKEASPDSPVVADTLGWVHLKRQSYLLAKSQFEFALEKLPENATMAYHLALALRGNNQPEEAREILHGLMKEKVTFPERKDAEKLLEEL